MRLVQFLGFGSAQTLRKLTDLSEIKAKKLGGRLLPLIISACYTDPEKRVPSNNPVA